MTVYQTCEPKLSIQTKTKTEEAKRVRAAPNSHPLREMGSEERIAYSAIVEGIEGHDGTVLVVMQRKGNDNAKELYEVLLKKFCVHHIALLQMELANFKMAPNETG